MSDTIKFSGLNDLDNAILGIVDDKSIEKRSYRLGGEKKECKDPHVDTDKDTERMIVDEADSLKKEIGRNQIKKLSSVIFPSVKRVEEVEKVASEEKVASSMVDGFNYVSRNVEIDDHDGTEYESEGTIRHILETKKNV